MNRWKWLFAIMFGLTLPVLAQDAEDAESEDSDETTPAAVAESKPAETTADKPSPIRRLIELRLDEHLVPARMIDIPLPGRTRTLQEVLERFDEWSEDESVGAVLMDIGDVALAIPDVEELRAGVIRLKQSGKKVMAFLNGGGPEAYLLACAADEIAAAPTGGLMIPGLGRLFPYMKGYYQMQGLEFDVITAGRYKYPGFVNEREPNPFFKAEMDAIFDSWFADYKNIIAESRNLSLETVSEIIDIALFDSTQAQQRGLIDELAYYDDYRDRLLKRDKMKRFKEEESAWANVKSLQDIAELINRELKKTEEARKAVGPKIAVLHARGPIIDQNLGALVASQVICRDDFSEVVDELRKNDSIKAVVMRVDSPGGSGYASDVIWKHLRALDEAKPLVVSMGTVAGSGGYYIACPARRIFAQPTTITGSIGVIGMFQSAWSMFNRMDYDIAEMKRGARATLGAPHRNLSKEDRAFFQGYIDEFYKVFLDRVAASRRMPADEVHKIAEGRIWTGRDALKIGLVDELGGLEDAIQSARKMANIPESAEVKIVHYPRPSSLGELFESFSGMGVEQMVTQALQANSPAQPIPFHQQLLMFSQDLRPLCWMAMPEFYQAPSIPMPGSISPVGAPWSYLNGTMPTNGASN